MAIYHFSGTMISRSQGRSAIACAAYRSGSRLHDDRQDKTYDYTKKSDVIHTEILAPKNAPDWMRDREKLWNAVETIENRKDAQLAREFNFALPAELSNEQNLALAREFVQNEFVKKGMVADLAFHNHKNRDGQMQPHIHVMLTLRTVTAEGFGKKDRSWNAKDLLLQWRISWAEYANRHLFMHGYDIKIDNRTLEAQGIDLEPQHKIGAADARDRMARLEDHQRIARENGEKLLAEPEIALIAITHQQSTFTRQDIARFVNRHTVDGEQFQAVYDKVLASQDLISLGLDRKQQERFTTREMLAVERKMLEHATKLNARHRHVVKNKYQKRAASARNLRPEQQIAFEHLISAGDLKNVVGYAGTGKSYLLGAAREAWERQGYIVHGVALSGIAAENLEAGSGIVSRTIASRLYFWDKNEERLTPRDILVVDEAGMIGSKQLCRLLEETQKAGAKIVLVGDPYQLQSIEAGSAFRAISKRFDPVMLTEIRRQNIAWQRDATVAFAEGQTATALEQYQKHDHVHAFETNITAKQGLVELWNDVRLNEPDKTQIMLAYTRVDVKELNEIARKLRHENNELGVDHTIVTARGNRTFAEHDRVYFLENDRALGVKNGTLGTIEKINGKELSVRLDFDAVINFSTDRYNQLDYGYAATIHKSQGVTVDRTYIFGSKYMDAHSTYVVFSRHRESVDLFYSSEEFPTDRALERILSRERIKDVTLDYTDPDKFTEEQLKANSNKLRELRDLKNSALTKKSNEPVTPSHKHLEAIRKMLELKTKIDWQSPHFQNEWENLRKSEERSVKILVGFYDQLLKNRDPQKIASIQQSIEGMAIKITERSISEGLKESAPKLIEAVQSAVKIKKIISDQDKMAFDAAKVKWQSPEYKEEWENLRKSDDRSIKIFVGLYDLLVKSKDPKNAASLEESIDGLAIKISEKSSVKNIKESAPKLIEAVQQSIKLRDKIKERDLGIEREWD